MRHTNWTAAAQKLQCSRIQWAVWYRRRSLHSWNTLYYGCTKRVFFLATDDTLYRVPDNFVAVGGMYVGSNGETMYQILHPSKWDQRAVIQFLGAEGCQPVVIYHRMQAVYGNACVSKTTVNEWTKQFRQGRQSVNSWFGAARTIACGYNACQYCSCGSSCKKRQTYVYEGHCSELSHQCRDCTSNNSEHRVYAWFM